MQRKPRKAPAQWQLDGVTTQVDTRGIEGEEGSHRQLHRDAIQDERGSIRSPPDTDKSPCTCTKERTSSVDVVSKALASKFEYHGMPVAREGRRSKEDGKSLSGHNIGIQNWDRSLRMIFGINGHFTVCPV